jgi:hypothetical protein
VTKSILFGASEPTAYDGSMLLPPGDAIFPGTIMSVQFDDLSAVPTNGQTIYNRAWRQFAKLSGRDESDEADCHGTFVYGSNAASDKLKLELTPKGGLYGSPSHSTGDANTRAYVSASTAVKQYILDNTLLGGSNATDTAQAWNVEANHAIGHLVWLKMNRAGRTDSGKTGQNVIFYKLGGTSSSMTQAISTPAYPITGTENTGMTGTSATLVGTFYDPPLPTVVDVPNMRYAASRGWFSSKPATPADFDCICGFGPLPGQNAGGFQQSAPSFALYRWDIIDLRHAVPYGEAKAFRGIGNIDYRHTLSDLYEPRNVLTAAKRRAFALGGQFYGDTLPTPLA